MNLPNPPLSDTSPLPGAVYSKPNDAAYDVFRRNTLLLFFVFLACVADLLVSITDSSVAVSLYVLICVSAVIVGAKTLPKFLLLIMLIGPGIVALVYLLACYPQINRLKQPEKSLAWIGCVGLVVLTTAGVISLLVPDARLGGW